jgi:Tfp pilus assembly protein FimT
MGPRKARAFSLVEAIIAVVFVGIIAMIAVPRLNFAAVPRQKADCVASKIVADLRRTRGLAISHAADNSKGFSLTMLGTVPYAGYEIVNADTTEVVDYHTIDSAVSCTGGNNFEFGPLGNLRPGSDTQLIVSAEGKTLTITIISATGTIKCVEN